MSKKSRKRRFNREDREGIKGIQGERIAFNSYLVAQMTKGEEEAFVRELVESDKENSIFNSTEFDFVMDVLSGVTEVK